MLNIGLLFLLVASVLKDGIIWEVEGHLLNCLVSLPMPSGLRHKILTHDFLERLDENLPIVVVGINIHAFTRGHGLSI